MGTSDPHSKRLDLNSPREGARGRHHLLEVASAALLQLPFSVFNFEHIFNFCRNA